MVEPADERGLTASLRVYDGDEVDEYVLGLHAEIERLNTEIREMRDHLAHAVSPQDLEAAERALGRALLQAQSAADEAAEQARAEHAQDRPSDGDQALQQAIRERDEVRAVLERHHASLEAAHREAEDRRAQIEREGAAILAHAREQAENIVALARVQVEATSVRPAMPPEHGRPVDSPFAPREAAPSAQAPAPHWAPHPNAPAPPAPWLVGSDADTAPPDAPAVEQPPLLLPPPSGPPVIRLNGNGGPPSEANGRASGRRFRRRP